MAQAALQTVLEQIRIVDAKINGGRRELLRRSPGNIFSCQHWGFAWERHPDLRAREDALNERRWAAMEVRDAILLREARAAERRRHASARNSVLKRCDV